MIVLMMCSHLSPPDTMPGRLCVRQRLKLTARPVPVTPLPYSATASSSISRAVCVT